MASLRVFLPFSRVSRRKRRDWSLLGGKCVKIKNEKTELALGDIDADLTVFLLLGLSKNCSKIELLEDFVRLLYLLLDVYLLILVKAPL